MSNNSIHCPKCGANEPQPILQTRNIPKPTAGLKSIIILLITIIVSFVIGGNMSRTSRVFGFVLFFAITILGLIVCINVAKKEKLIERTNAVCQVCGNIWVLGDDT